MEHSLRRNRPRALGNLRAAEYAFFRRRVGLRAAVKVVGLALLHGVAQLLRQLVRKVRPAHRPRQQRVAVAVDEVRKIAGSVCIRRHADLARIDALRLARALIVGKEEDLVVTDRPTQRSAKLVLLVRASCRRKVVARIKIGVAQKIECAAVESVVAGFCNHADLTAAKLSILGVEVARHDAKLRNRIQVGNDRRTCVHVFFRVAAIHVEVIRSLTLPVHGNRAGIERTRWIENRRAHVLDGIGPDGGRRSHTRLQREKIGVTASVQRRRHHLPSADDLAQLCAHGLDVERIVRHAHGLRVTADGERSVQGE